MTKRQLGSKTNSRLVHRFPASNSVRGGKNDAEAGLGRPQLVIKKMLL